MTEKELLAHFDANDKYEIESPFIRPERPVFPPVVREGTKFKSESDPDEEESKHERSNQPSSLNDYTTIVQTNKTILTTPLANINMVEQKRDSESSESEKFKPIKNSRKGSANSANSATSSTKINEPKQPNMGKIDKSLSDDSSSSGTITPTKGKRRGTIYDSD